MEDAKGIPYHDPSPSPWTRIATYFKVEPLAFLVIFAWLTKSQAYSLLVQDKICLQTYNESESFCSMLSTSDTSPEKDRILSDVTKFVTTKELLGLIPGIISTIYIGSWCDKFPRARRLVVLVGVVGSIAETILLILLSTPRFFGLSVTLLLFTAVPTYVTGNSFFISILSFISVKSRPEDRAFRFLLLEVFIYIGTTSAFLLSGLILSSSWHLFPSRMRNYSDLFLVGGLCYCITFIWAFFSMKEPQKRSYPEIEESSTDGGEEMSESTPLILKMRKMPGLFSLSHLHDAWRTLFKRRKYDFHYTLWWLVFFMVLSNFPNSGAMTITFPLLQRLYKWDYVVYSEMSTISQVIKPIATIGIMPILFKVIKVRDLQISMIGVISHTVGSIFGGAILTPLGYFLSISISCIAGVATVGVRSFITKFVPSDEVAKIFSMIMLFETFHPFVSSMVYSSIFTWSLDNFYPTFAIHVTAFLTLVNLIIVCVIDNRWGDFKEPDTPRRSFADHSVSSTTKDVIYSCEKSRCSRSSYSSH